MKIIPLKNDELWGDQAHWRLDTNLLVSHLRGNPLAYREKWHEKTSLGVPYGLCIR